MHNPPHPGEAALSKRFSRTLEVSHKPLNFIFVS